jgi:hypothetical protein
MVGAEDSTEGDSSKTLHRGQSSSGTQAGDTDADASHAAFLSKCSLIEESLKCILVSEKPDRSAE